MQAKLKPGDTFSRDINGITYEIAVMSVGEMLDAEDALGEAKESSSATDHYRVWLDVVGRFVKSWTHDRPVEDIRYILDADGLADVMSAVMVGNKLEEADAKN